MAGKVAIVTGGAMGYKEGGPSIGGAISIRLAHDGYKVVVADLLEAGRQTVEIIESARGKAIFVKTDVTDDQGAQNVVNMAMSKFGDLTCLVNCVARYSPGMAKNVADITEEEWDKTMTVNLNGYFKMAKRSVPVILESGGGTIVNVSSMAAFQSLPNFSVYSVSKAAINALTRSLALDFAPAIRTNAICPGFVRIANSQNNRSGNELVKWYEEIARQYPMKRVCEVEEIANVAAFLASDQSSYINGQTIIVDGGKSIADSHQF